MTRPTRVLTFGDALVDVIVETGRPLVADDDVPAAIRLSAGGQAANVAAWAAHLGAPAAVITALGGDPAGRLVRDMLEERGVTVRSPPVDATGTVISLVSADGRRTMISDRDASAVLRGGDLLPEWFADVTWLHISGYALFGPDDPEAALAASSLARQAGARVSADLSAATLVVARGQDAVRSRLAATGAEVVFGNQLELRDLGVLDVATRVEKLGAGGCRVWVDGVGRHVPAVSPRVLRDTTGAGDALAAGWLVGGVAAAMQAAAECVALAGAMPPAPAARLSGS